MNDASSDSPRGPDKADVYHQRISVPFDYPVHFAHHVLAGDNELLAGVLDRLGEGRRHRAIVYVDEGLAAAQGDVVDRIKEYFHARPRRLELAGPPQLVPGGEVAKNGWAVVRDILTTAGNLHLDRQSFVVAFGGGAVLDMVGFAASLVHRGLRLVRVPTTTLAQNDAGVGVKNGMDEHGQKNYIGTFAPPFAVVNDFEFLRTLADRDWVGGIAEAFKVALIKDVEFFRFLCDRAGDLRRRDQAAMEHCVRRCAILHLEHIRAGGDPFEFGSARPLDFGHWIGHKLETMSDYRLGHGQCVAIGLAVDSFYAMRQGLLGEGDFERILTGLTDCGLPVWSELLRCRAADGTLEILRGLEDFREHLGGSLNITLPDTLGRKCEVHEVHPAVIEDAVEHLAGLAGPPREPSGTPE
ncbi:MAG TPA: 3-dehydroquinate synthase [Phycisphaerae bacterium]|nr:3-dehydroquinate synthase [Phycisphaerae bacterium]